MRIFPEFLDLTLDDVGRSIELVYTPMRKDGVKGNPKSVITGEISPGELYGEQLIIDLFVYFFISALDPMPIALT